MFLVRDFFQVDTPPTLLVTGSYDPWLVTLSILVAMFASSMSLQIVGQGAGISNRTTRFLTLLGGSVALGCGVFSMHFVAMLSFDLCTTVKYDRSITLLSVVPSLLASGIAFNFMSRHHTTLRELAVSGALVGAGIGAMHYTGMAAMQMSVLLRYDPWFFTLSIAVAVALATLALWIRYGLENLSARLSKYWLILIGGCVMGLAISGMHYTGMAAARFITTPETVLTRNDTDPSFLALSVSLITIAFSGLVFGVNALLKYRDLVANLRSMSRDQQRFRFLSEFSNDAHLIFDETGIIECNPAAIQILGAARREELIGLHPARFSPERQPDGMLSSEKSRIMDALARKNGFHQFEWIHQRLDGSEFPVEVTLKPIEIEGKWAIVVVWHDLTQAKALAEGLLKAKEHAEAASRSKSNFLATMSHEIRTPMNSIIGFTEVLLGGEVIGRQRDHLEVVRNSAKSLLRILNDILDTAKLEQGAIELESISFCMRDVLDQLMNILGLEAKAKGLTLAVHRDPAISDYYIGDPLRIRQVLINLLGNSIKFTDRGKVTLSVYPDEGGVHFQIDDTGIGIAEDRLEKIFEPFTQADPSMTRRFGGTGLGTNISKQLTEIMGGRIWAESQLEKGSTFHIVLPLQKGEKSAKKESGSIRLPRLRILIVDDVEQNVELISLLFAEHSVASALNGMDAIRAASDFTFDLILMDVQMPGMDGLEATRRIRSEETKKGKAPVPIVALSASVFEEDRNAAAEAGMSGFVSKPIDMDILLAEIGRVLHLRPQDPTLPQPDSADGDLDLARGLRLFQTRERYLEAIQIFLAENSDVIAQSSVEFSSHGMESMLSLTHRLRGVGGNLGARRFAKAVEDLETALRSGTASIDKLWENVQDSFARARSILLDFEKSEMIPRPADSPLAVAAPFDHKAALHQATILLESLGRGALDEAALKRFYQLVQGRVHASGLQTLQSAVSRFDFDKAQSVIQSMAESIRSFETTDKS